MRVYRPSVAPCAVTAIRATSALGIAAADDAQHGPRSPLRRLGVGADAERAADGDVWVGGLL